MDPCHTLQMHRGAGSRSTKFRDHASEFGERVSEAVHGESHVANVHCLERRVHGGTRPGEGDEIDDGVGSHRGLHDGSGRRRVVRYGWPARYGSGQASPGEGCAGTRACSGQRGEACPGQGGKRRQLSRASTSADEDTLSRSVDRSGHAKSRRTVLGVFPRIRYPIPTSGWITIRTVHAHFGR